MSTTDELVAANRSYAASFGLAGTPVRPARNVAVVACMDCRLDVLELAGLAVGDAHVIRNAGGILTDDVMRSLVISQRALGTTEIVLVHHTDCGMLTFTDEEMATALESEAGARPPFAFGAFADLDTDVRDALARIEASPFLLHKNPRGFVYDVGTGELREVTR